MSTGVVFCFAYVMENMPPKKTPDKMSPKKKKEILWKDDDVELLLNITNEYKIP